ncbi:sigma 54-interacting transcriptional regulator, partial [Desulfosporosinus sp.]|uniref:sigma 54-interacting transcriptional regulator n=1 Tax=Desulfosporosinus sp. TaxID=157907 RepID=UPI0026274FE1
VLQEREVRRVGSDRIIPIDVRILSATNKDLLSEVRQENFRQDLYYRLNVLNLKLPSLRERKDDIEDLANLFIRRIRQKINKKVPLLSSSQATKLCNYHWPGNIRELENFMERYVLLYKTDQNGEQLIEKFLMENISKETEEGNLSADLFPVRIGPLKEMELRILYELVERRKMDRNVVADLLGISRTTVWKRLKEMTG